jgi:lactate dehydrogenase-like 2-hydroxyacid dehydrogenase
VHKAETRGDLERLTPAIREKIRGVAVTYHTVRADKDSLSQLPKIEMVASFGVGYDHIDAKYAAEHNIIVTNTPDVLTEEVADVAMGLLISTVREFIKADRYVRSGLWQTQNYPLSVGSLRDRKVGIVGMGRIGQAIAQRAAAFGMRIAYTARSAKAELPHRYLPNAAALAAESDYLVVITPGGAGTRKLIDATVLRALGPQGCVVNVARGSVIDETALIAALRAGEIAGAALDVFENEPNVPDELRAMDNVLLTPHIGSATAQTRRAMAELAFANLDARLHDRAVLTPVPECR